MVVHRKKEGVLEIDIKGWGEAQIRLVKSLNTLLKSVAASQNEVEFFEASAEALRACASLIKQSQFPENEGLSGGIPYAEQALEYSIDTLQEYVSSSKVVRYDH